MILGAVVVITAVVWYLNYQKPAREELVPLTRLAGSSATEQKLRVIKLDFSILDSSLFKSLKSHGALPVTSDETGRENPFEPY